MSDSEEDQIQNKPSTIQNWNDLIENLKAESYQKYLLMKTSLQNITHKKILQKIYQSYTPNHTKLNIPYYEAKHFKTLQKTLPTLPQTHIFELNIPQKHLNSPGSANLAIGLKNMPKFEQLILNISSNNIGPYGMRNLVRGLKRLHHLKKLNLNVSNNYMNDRGLTFIVESLKNYTNLQSFSINFGGCSIGFEGIKSLVQNLSKITNLYEFHLHMDSIDDQQLKEMAKGLTALKQLRVISLKFKGRMRGTQEFTKQQVEILGKSLGSLQVLEKLQIKNVQWDKLKLPELKLFTKHLASIDSLKFFQKSESFNPKDNKTKKTDAMAKYLQKEKPKVKQQTGLFF